MSNYLVVGHFSSPEETMKAISSVRVEGFGELKLYSPFPHHGLDDLLYEGKTRSPVRRFTLVGGIAGCLGAFLMTTWMSRDWPLRTSAKPIVSIPPFVVIAFECTILLGAIFTLVGMLLNSRIPNILHDSSFRPEFSSGTFGLGLKVAKDSIDQSQDSLLKAGAQKVEVNYVR